MIERKNRDRNIIDLIVNTRLSFREIGALFGLTHVRIVQIKKENKKVINSLLEEKYKKIIESIK